jgi:hypothetical protein
MTQSMSRCFPDEIWEACDVPHPDKETERESCNKDTKNFEKAEKQGEAKRTYIDWEDGLEEEGAVKILEERQMAALAKESGWSVLDVEEVHEYFAEYSTDGRVGLRSSHFENLMLRLYNDEEPPKMEEVRAFIHKVIAALRSRRREQDAQGMVAQTPKGTHRSRKMSYAESSFASMDTEDDSKADQLTFAEFYFALTRWLHRGTKDKHKILPRALSRFSDDFSKDQHSLDSDPEHIAALEQEEDTILEEVGEE